MFFFSFTEKPELQIPGSFVRALSGYWLWCSAKGTPPIYITITKSSNQLVKSTGFAKVRVYEHEEGTYRCNAWNEAGIDSKEIQVTLVTSILLSFSSENIKQGTDICLIFSEYLSL